jgi:hypothetical protein
MQIADLLSHHTFKCPAFKIFNSLRKFHTHNISLNPRDMALYSASAVDGYSCDGARKELWRLVDVGAVSPCAW